MKIIRLDIDGFRGIRSGKVLLGDFTTLIGANNCGKTTVVEALALMLGRDRLVRNLTEHDFFGSDPAVADRIKIIATIGGFHPNDPDHHHEWFRPGRAIEKWSNPITGDLRADQDMEATELVAQIAFCARFDRETLEAESIRYFFDDAQEDDPFAEDATVTPVPGSLIRGLGLFLVPASRTWDRMMSFGSELFRRTVNYVGGNPASAVLEERDRLRDPVSPLEQDDKLEELMGQVNADLQKLFGREIGIALRLTSTDSEGVLEAVMPHFKEPGRPALPARRHGNGLISLQTLILLMRFGFVRKQRGDNFIIVVEEPELHVPPPQQRKLLHFLKGMANQVVITSHSPTVSAVADPHQLVLLVNSNGTLSARPLLPSPIGQEANAVRRSLFLSERHATVSAVMHPSVLIPEGKFDARWLTLLCRVADLTEPADSNEATFTHEVGLIQTKDARITETYLDLVKVHPSLTCLVDGDAAGNTYRNALSQAVPPCPRIIRWPNNWEIEDVIAWICQADMTVVDHPDLAGFAVPNQLAELTAFLKSDLRKGDEVLHIALADAISSNTACSRRARHVLSILASIATGRQPVAGSAALQVLNGGASTIWTFNSAFQGI